MILRRRVCGVFLQLAALVLFAFAGTASASMLTVSVSGQFGSGVTADQLAAPDATWAISFDVASNPVAANTDAFSFDAPFSDFSYLLNGSAVALSPQSIRFFESGDGGLFTLFFGPRRVSSTACRFPNSASPGIRCSQERLAVPPFSPAVIPWAT